MNTNDDLRWRDQKNEPISPATNSWYIICTIYGDMLHMRACWDHDDGEDIIWLETNRLDTIEDFDLIHKWRPSIPGIDSPVAEEDSNEH